MQHGGDVRRPKPGYRPRHSQHRGLPSGFSYGACRDWMPFQILTEGRRTYRGIHPSALDFLKQEHEAALRKDGPW